MIPFMRLLGEVQLIKMAAQTEWLLLAKSLKLMCYGMPTDVQGLDLPKFSISKPTAQVQKLAIALKPNPWEQLSRKEEREKTV